MLDILKASRISWLSACALIARKSCYDAAAAATRQRLAVRALISYTNQREARGSNVSRAVQADV